MERRTHPGYLSGGEAAREAQRTGETVTSITNIKRDLHCDACGILLQGKNWHCKKCNIWFCFGCGIALIKSCDDYPLKCPMCDKTIAVDTASSSVHSKVVSIGVATTRKCLRCGVPIKDYGGLWCKACSTKEW